MQFPQYDTHQLWIKHMCDFYMVDDKTDEKKARGLTMKEGPESHLQYKIDKRLIFNCFIVHHMKIVHSVS